MMVFKSILVGTVAAAGLMAPAAPSVTPGGVQLWENGPYWVESNVGATKPDAPVIRD